MSKTSLVGLCGGAPVTPEEEAVFNTCAKVYGVNHHSPFKNGREVDVACVNFNNDHECWHKINAYETVELATHLPFSSFNATAGLSACCWALRECPDAMIYLGGMDLYEGQESPKGHDLDTEALCYRALYNAHKERLVFSDRLRSAVLKRLKTFSLFQLP